VARFIRSVNRAALWVSLLLAVGGGITSSYGVVATHSRVSKVSEMYAWIGSIAILGVFVFSIVYLVWLKKRGDSKR